MLSFLSFADKPVKNQIPPLPAKQMLEKIIESERSNPRDSLNLLRVQKVTWHPQVMPRSIRSWMMEEFSSETWQKIKASDKL